MPRCNNADIAASAVDVYDDDDDNQVMEPDAEQILKQIIDDDDVRRSSSCSATAQNVIPIHHSSLTLPEFFLLSNDAFENMHTCLTSDTPTRTPKREDGDFVEYTNSAPYLMHTCTHSKSNANNSSKNSNSHSESLTEPPSMDRHCFFAPPLAVGTHDCALMCADIHTPATNVCPAVSRKGDACDVPASPDTYNKTVLADWCSRIFGTVAAFSPMTIRAELFEGKVYQIAVDQHGCRFLQQWLDVNCSVESMIIITNEIVPHMEKLMSDQYANFLIQKLFDIMPSEIRYRVVCATMPSIDRVALTPHGTFSVQKMIETAASSMEMRFISESLSRNVLCLIMDCNGSHAVQKLVQHFEEAYKLFIYDAVIAQCALVAKNRQGCCVLQRCVKYASQPYRDKLVDCVLSCCLDIVQDPFGNYVLQYILEPQNARPNDVVAIAFLPYLVHLCMNKFSSNVVEKVLRYASPYVQQMYIETMCNPSIAARLMQDKYGNYVLQSALGIGPSAQSNSLAGVVRSLMPTIQSASYAKKLELKLNEVTRKCVECRNPTLSPTFARTDADASEDDHVGEHASHRLDNEDSHRM